VVGVVLWWGGVGGGGVGGGGGGGGGGVGGVGVWLGVGGGFGVGGCCVQFLFVCWPPSFSGEAGDVSAGASPGSMRRSKCQQKIDRRSKRQVQDKQRKESATPRESRTRDQSEE